MGDRMKKVTILALHLGYGGIERAIANLANFICDEYEVTIVSTYKLYDKPAYEFDPKIKVEYLMDGKIAVKVDAYKQLLREKRLGKLGKLLFRDYVKKGKISDLFKDIKSSFINVREKKQKMISYIMSCDSDIIISTRDIHNTWLGQYGKQDSMKIGWEHNHHNNNDKYINKIVQSVQKLDYFVLVSEELKQFYEEQLKDSACRCIYIANSIDRLPDELSNLEEPNLISVGRLSPEKGQLDIVEIMKKLHPLFPTWTLEIIGDGVLRESLEAKIKKEGLEDVIKLAGFQNQDYIQSKLSHSSLFIMTSYTESFGIVLLEAFAYGVPCIAFNSAQGANDIIKNNTNGYLIPNRDIDLMCKRISDLIKQEAKRKVFGLSARKTAEKYDAHAIAQEWKCLFEKEKQ